MNKYFSTNPRIKISRTRFPMHSTHKTTFNGSYLVPIKVYENIPGDTFSVSMNAVIEMTTPLKPTMDLAICNVYAFKVPMRIIWEHWQEMFGENDDTYWAQPIDYLVPQLTAPEGGWDKDSIMSHAGVRMGTQNTVSALIPRAIAKIYNDWFRDENVMVPYLELKDDTNRTGSNGDGKNDLVLGGKCPRIAKFHDMFTTALPGPIKSTEDVLLPLGTSAPVAISAQSNNGFMTFTNNSGTRGGLQTYNPEQITNTESKAGVQFRAFTGDPLIQDGAWLNYSAGLKGVVDLTNAAGATMQDFLYAYSLYKMFTIDARGGTRYTEILANHYGVISSDARLQRSEYLGGTNFEINMVHVPQTSQTTEGSPQGYLTAYSNTGVSDRHLFTTSYDEHCYTIIFAAVRTKQTYAQGTEKMWYHKERTDFYMPSFAHIGQIA